MVPGVLTRLASFSLARPKTTMMIAAALAIGVFAIHYKMLVSERDKLLVAEQGYERAVAAFEAREVTLQADILAERQAAATAVAERDTARRAVESFRAGRTDQPSKDWAAQPIPPGEVERLCVALPEMDGCQSTPRND